MDNKYMENPKILKALSDTTRLMIMNILSDGELSEDEISKRIHIKPHSLSHHMRTLFSAELILLRREGDKAYYRQNSQAIPSFMPLLDEITQNTKSTICEKGQ